MAEIEYKIILTGDSDSGKTIFFKKLTTESINEKNISTIGMDKRTLKFNIDIDKNGKKENRNFIITLVETAGQERFRAITQGYFRGSAGIFILYNINSRNSFENVESWIKSIKESIGNNDESKYAMVLIGNKVYFEEEGKKESDVKEEEAIKTCEKYDMIWGGEIDLKDMDCNILNERIKDILKEIYRRVGERKSEVPKNKIIYKKERKNCICF